MNMMEPRYRGHGVTSRVSSKDWSSSVSAALIVEVATIQQFVDGGGAHHFCLQMAELRPTPNEEHQLM